MTDYPDDIMKAAAAAHAEFADSRVTDNLTVIIARAIMNERQRCADIAWSRLPACQDTQYEDGAERVIYIAEAIERGDHV